MTEGDRVIGYVRVSTVEQGTAGVSLEAQQAAIEAECRRRGWQLVRIDQDTASGKTMRKRHGLEAALGSLEAGEASGVVVAKLDRLSRSLLDFATLVERSRGQGWQLVVLDMDFDMTTPIGEAMANMLATFAQFERRMIGQRTKDALAVKRSQGVKLGRRRELDPAVHRRIIRERSQGRTLAEIAHRLNADGVPGAHGGVWHASTVRYVLTSRN